MTACTYLTGFTRVIVANPADRSVIPQVFIFDKLFGFFFSSSEYVCDSLMEAITKGRCTLCPDCQALDAIHGLQQAVARFASALRRHISGMCARSCVLC